jgi:SAM-dependent methyltransferase
VRERLLTVSQERWRGDEPAIGLTWGNMMDGSSLWKIYARMRAFKSSDRILEIGPGYGRLLKTALERQIPFDLYRGVELSQARVVRLREEFPDQRIQFEAGDVNNWSSPSLFDVVICSSTFEHLYPDCRGALKNLRTQLAPGAHVFIDLPAAMDSRSGFEPNGTFVRWYPNDELSAIFTECGYQVVDIERCTLGESVLGTMIDRSVVIARPRASP